MSTRKNKKIKLDASDIKYNICNTELPVIITHDDKIYFDIDPKDEKAIKSNNQSKIEEYQQKIDKTMEYLILEGFLSQSIDN